MSETSRRYLFFVSKPYSFAILEPLQNYIETGSLGQVCWFLASTARDYPAPGKILSTTQDVKEFNPDAVLAPGNVVPPAWPGLKVQMFHGLDDETKRFYRVNGLFDLYCTAGPATTAGFSKRAKRYGHFLVKETGWPKLDPFVQSHNRQLMRRELGLDPQRPVVLYAPTFPPKYTSAVYLLHAISRLLDEDLFWLVKFHPLMDREVVRNYRKLRGERLVVVDELSILPSMQAADILLTDTSSVAYEFMQLDRPIITFRALARQDKGIDLDNPSQLPGAIRRSLEQPMEFAAQRAAYLAELHPYGDGESSRRVVEAIESVLTGDERARLRRKPLNLIRRMQINRMIVR